MQCPKCYGSLEKTTSVRAEDEVTCDGEDCGHIIIDGQTAWKCVNCGKDWCELCKPIAPEGRERARKPPARLYVARTCAPPHRF